MVTPAPAKTQIRIWVQLDCAGQLVPEASEGWRSYAGSVGPSGKDDGTGGRGLRAGEV